MPASTAGKPLEFWFILESLRTRYRFMVFGEVRSNIYNWYILNASPRHVAVKSNAIFVPAFNFSTNVCVFFLFGYFFIFDFTPLLMYLKLLAFTVVISLFILFVKAQPSVALIPHGMA